jgi:hypothetical protein
MDVCCVLSSRERSLRRADHFSRGVLQSSVYPVNVILKPLRGGHDPESGGRAREEGKGEAFCYIRLQKPNVIVAQGNVKLSTEHTLTGFEYLCLQENHNYISHQNQ